ncbi:MAG TPA: alpha/beta hydrolase, partial [Hyphomicrobiaceae bacterium]|nr:alpha/beta hydrolase [Hyphomicrobiaceae bacterium]
NTVDIAIVVVAALLYGFIWFASRNLSRLAKIICRLAPLGLVIPVILFTSGIRLEQPPPTMAGRDGGGGASREAEVAARKEAEEQRAAAERRATEEGARRQAEAARKAEEERMAAERRLAEAAASREAEERRTKQAEEAAAKRLAEAPPPAERPVAAAPGTPSAAPTRSARPAMPKPAEPPPGSPSAPQAAWDVVPVFYGTDRVHKDEPKRITYTSDRARRLELGRALVTVPKTHQVPNIERPFAIRVPYFNVTIYEQAEDPAKHFTISELAALTREEFIGLVRKRIGGSTAFKDQAVVFVHGYNTSFDYALFRAAQMAYDLKFDGASFVYSWPSGGGVMSYNYDRESSEQAEPYLREFIELVIKDSGAQSVSVIAHSMGNMPLLRVLQALGPSLPPGVRLNQIILAAPDVDRNLFENLAANLKSYGRGVTLYCSNNDLAMTAARKVAGGIPRAGDVPPDGPIVLAGIDTIDVSQTSTEYLTLNHSTYAEKGALLNDIALLLQTGERPPDKRIPILRRISTPRGDFWRYP